MSFRARLTLFFLGIVVIPLGVSTVVVNRIAENQALQRTDSRLVGLAVGAQALIDSAQRQATTAVGGDRATGSTGVALDAVDAATSTPVSARTGALNAIRTKAGLDYLIVVSSGEIFAASLRPADFLPGIDVSPDRLAAEDGPGGLVIGYQVRVRIVGQPQLLVAGGFYEDARFLKSLATQAMTVSSGRVVASTVGRASLPPGLEPGEPFDVTDRLRGICASCSAVGPISGVVVVVPRLATNPLGDLSIPVLIVIVLGALAATVLSYLLARLLSRPIEQITQEAIAATPAGTDMGAAGPDDLARLSTALGAIRSHLQTTVAELDESRGELRRGLERLGETLMATARSGRAARGGAGGRSGHPRCRDRDGVPPVRPTW